MLSPHTNVAHGNECCSTFDPRRRLNASIAGSRLRVPLRKSIFYQLAQAGIFSDFDSRPFR